MKKKEEKAPHGTQEWAAHNVNIQDGCEHDCRYCYAKTMAIRFKRASALSWKEPRLRTHAIERKYPKRSGRIMFPTAHDITEHNLEACVAILKKMLEAGNAVLVVSKPRMTCVRRLCSELEPFKEQVTFRFSISSSSDAVLKFWEPHAPGYRERLRCLKYASEQGFDTSVSCEPMLDANIEKVVEAVRPYVTDSIWLGKVNRLRHIIPHTCPGHKETARKAEALIALQSDENILALYERYRHDPMI